MCYKGSSVFLCKSPGRWKWGSLWDLLCLRGQKLKGEWTLVGKCLTPGQGDGEGLTPGQGDGEGLTPGQGDGEGLTPGQGDVTGREGLTGNKRPHGFCTLTGVNNSSTYHNMIPDVLQVLVKLYPTWLKISSFFLQNFQKVCPSRLIWFWNLTSGMRNLESTITILNSGQHRGKNCVLYYVKLSTLIL